MDATNYDRFSVVIYAPPAVRDDVEELRRLAPPCGRPMMEAHVTVKGSFVHPTDLNEIAERTRLCCAAAQPFTITAPHWHFSGDAEQAIITLRVENTEPLDAFHWHLVREIKDLCVTDYFGEDIGFFRPHITLVQAFPPEEMAWALAVVQRHQPRYTFEAIEASLCGRRDGQTWEPLATFPLGSASQR
jgi:2'-5' RNA ligase